jgi:hypothetical protein
MVALDVSYNPVTSLTVQSLSKRAGSLRSVNFNPPWGDVRLKDAPWEDFCQKCGPLTVAMLEYVDLTDSALTALAKRSPNLQQLSVSGNKSLTDASFVEVANSCPSLQILEMTTCHKVTDKTIEALHSLKQLKSLRVDLGNALPVSRKAIARLTNEINPKLLHLGSIYDHDN